MMAESEAKAPQVSVVIASRNRETRLAFALDALAEQEIDPGRFEVIVVRDGPFTGMRTTAPEGLAVRFEDLPERVGPGLARDHGWRLARAPLIAFTDDDCRPSAGWLGALLDAWEAEGRDESVILQGRVDPDPDEVHLLQRLARSQRINEQSPYYQCCNIAYPRALLERVGGFDPDFAFGGEDTDLALRAIEAGARPVYFDGVLVWHAVHPRGVGKAVRDGLAWETIPLLVARHPQLREAIVHRLFWKEAHEYLLLAAAGALLAKRTRGASLIAAAPYVRWHWDRRVKPTPRRLAGYAVYLSERVAVDGAEIVGTVRAALRARTPML